MSPEAVIEHAQTLQRKAREHKRAERHHRYMARLKMTELRALCEEYGITLVETDRDPQGGQSPDEHH